MNGHLSRRIVNALKRTLKAAGQPTLCYLAPSGVYRTDKSPCRRCALTAPFTLTEKSAVYFCCTLLGLPPPDVIGTLPWSRTFLMQCMRPFAASIFLENYHPPQVSHSTCCLLYIYCTDDGMILSIHSLSSKLAMGGVLCF